MYNKAADKTGKGMKGLYPGQQGDFTTQLWKWVEDVTYICVLSFLWLLCSLPVFTAGAASVGMYTVFWRKLELGEKDILKPFFSGFCGSFGRATRVWLLLLAAGLLFGVDAWFYLVRRPGGYHTVLGAVMLLLLAAVTALALYVFPLMARYEGGARETLRRAACSAWKAWPWMLASLLAVAVVVGLFRAGLWQMVLFGAGIVAYANTRALRHALKKDIPGGRGKARF